MLCEENIKEKSVLIITGGNIDKKFLKDFLNERSFNIIIAVDKGLETADELGLEIDYLLGDFDTVSKEILEKYKKAASGEKSTFVIRKFIPEKDNTDTEIAIDTAISLNPNSITIVGATGTRVDHMMANINILLKALRKNIRAYIYDANNKIYLINKNHYIKNREIYGKFFSLLPLTEKVTGVNLINVKYPLDNATLVIGESLGISNEILGETAYIELKTGVLIVVESRD